MIRYLIAGGIIAVLIGGFFVIAEMMPEGTGQEVPSVQGVNTSYSSPGEFSQGELLVRFNTTGWKSSDIMNGTIAETNAAIGATVITDYTPLGIAGLQLVLLPPGMNTSMAITYYESIPFVDYAEVNAVYTIAGDANQTPSSNQTTVSSQSANESQILVRFNTSSFNTSEEMSVFANSTRLAINASLIRDYGPLGIPGLELVGIEPNMTIQDGLQYYRNLSQVAYAEPNLQYSV